MTLQRKIVATLLITGFCYGLVEFAVQKWIVYPSFIDIENIQAKHNVNRCIRALQRENEHLNKYCYDWAAWDECALYVQGKNTDFIQQNAVETTFMTQRFNLICFLDANDRFVWGKCVTFDDNEAIEVSVHEFSPAVLKQEHAMLGHKTPEDYIKGVFMTELGPMMVSSRPITNNDNTLPIHGTLIMGRLINDKFMTPLTEQTQVDFEWWNLASEMTQQSLEPYLSALSERNPILLERRPADTYVAAYQVVPGLNAKRALLLKAMTPRQITAEGTYAISIAMWSMIIGGGLILITILVMLEILILKPTRTLNDFALHIARTDDLTGQIKLGTNDEIASLADSFNAMISRLHQTQLEATERSYNAGVTELASEVLHNIRNSLTSLKIEIDSLNRQVQKFPLEQIKQAREDLANPALPGKKREELEQFLDAADQNLAETLDHLSIGFKIIAEPLEQIEQSLTPTSGLS